MAAIGFSGNNAEIVLFVIAWGFIYFSVFRILAHFFPHLLIPVRIVPGQHASRSVLQHAQVTDGS